MGLFRRIAKKAKSDRPALVALLGDLHINSTVGLPPGLSWPRDDGGTHLVTRTQRWLWEAWNHYWAFIDAKRKEHKADLFIVINGDIVDGDHHDTRQTITRLESSWLRMAAHVLDPIAQRTEPERFFILRGTEAHGGKGGAWDEAIAEDLGAHPARYNKDKTVAAYSHNRLYLEVNGVKFDIKHHTGRSKVPRSKGGTAGRKASDIMMIYMDRGDWPPDLVVRSHVHKSEDSKQTHRTRTIILPCWQGPTAYGHKIAEDLPDIGAAWALCQDEHFEADVEMYPLKDEAIQWITF